MSLTITTDVFCDGPKCDTWIHGDVAVSTIRAHAARAAAGKRGWVRVKRDGRLVDLCPSCAARVKQVTPASPALDLDDNGLPRDGN